MNHFAALALGAVAAFLAAFLLGYVLIPWLHKLKFGQTILDIGPKWHKNKQGTPTMGGMLFVIGIIAALIAVLVTDKIMGGDLVAGEAMDRRAAKVKFYGGILMALCYGFVGFADDYIKVAKKRNLGLTIPQKSIAQILIMGVYLGTLYSVGATYMYLPFIGNVDLKWFSLIFGLIVMYCTVNAVNFTDGIDGLCSSVTAVAAISLTVIAILRHNFGVSLLTACLCGGMCGYLIWNWNPAKVMMGDLGSMFLGGMIIAVCYALDMPWLILLVGIIYVIEFLSDVIQIVYFKATHGKRIFKMAPIHHHFEMCGWKEKKICYVFSAVNAVGGILAILLVYFGGAK
ncbi:MAG: phospho-N-acetylmuramoyl-pentapeptide-transferase [Clostridia bacterium]|nr:phospho-N-acetylmuramoyl-pentapeptide-transferase [Clostridia bacterium]